MMNDRQHYSTPKPLGEVMSLLERRLETPIVPGELSAWLASASEAFDQVEPLLRAHIEKDHAEQLKEIRNQDAELAHRVSQLREEDARILAEFGVLRQELASLAKQGEQTPVPKSGPAYDAAEKMADRGLKLAVAFRKQEAAIATWFVEAFQRDRGPVD
ncbi:MAG: hypothetical protein DWQ37_03000 [Planctomycetota bacterium]|nr:MAG: hypothetical protein DWQ37_03000 [Planctomycetota bacterium]